MRRHLTRLGSGISLAIALLLIVPAPNGVALEGGRYSISKRHLRAYWEFPISAELSASSSFIRVVREGDTLGAERTVAIIPLRNILTKGGFEVAFSETGILKLLHRQHEADKEPVLVAAQKQVSGWYPRTELCNDLALNAECQYEITLQDQQSSLDITVTYSK